MKFEALNKLQQRLMLIDPELLSLVSQDGGLRGLFDAGSSEYEQSTMADRVSRLERFYEVGLTVEHLREPFIEVMYASGYDRDAGHEAFNRGVQEALDHLLRFRILPPLRQLAEQAE